MIFNFWHDSFRFYSSIYRKQNPSDVSSSLGYTVFICWPTRYVYDSKRLGDTEFVLIVFNPRRLFEALCPDNFSFKRFSKTHSTISVCRRTDVYIAKRLFLLGTMERASLLCLLVNPYMSSVQLGHWYLQKWLKFIFAFHYYPRRQVSRIKEFIN